MKNDYRSSADTTSVLKNIPSFANVFTKEKILKNTICFQL